MTGRNAELACGEQVASSRVVQSFTGGKLWFVVFPELVEVDLRSSTVHVGQAVSWINAVPATEKLPRRDAGQR